MSSLVESYLKRITFDGGLSETYDTLSALQANHLQYVPFENLDVFHRRGVTVGQATSVEKVVGGRGGWCFELNGAFAWLLTELGFEVDKVACTVMLGNSESEVPDHLALIVHIGDKRYLTDVGFGDSFVQPLDLDSDQPVEDLSGEYRLVGDQELMLESRQASGEAWKQSYRIDVTPRQLAEFASHSNYLQTEPGLKWTTRPFATRLLRNGRVTLLKDRLKMTSPGGTTEFLVSPEDWPVLLGQWFAIDDSLLRD